jgi:amidase
MPQDRPHDNWSAPNDPLGAFCRHNHVSLRGSGGGALQGLTFAVKDCFHIAGTPTGFGQPDWLTSQPVPTVTAEAVCRLLEAGADMVAKTHCDELCYSLTGENAHYGTPRNVAAPGRIPGGSSNGSAAAVAGALIDFAIGTDCGGSIRIPASYCGILGIRPTHGRVSLEAVVPFGPSFDVAGWFARDAGIFERVGEVLLGPDPFDATPKRLVVLTDAFAMVEPPVRDALRPAVDRLRQLVPETVSVDISRSRLSEWFDVFKIVQASEVWANHGDWITRTRPALGPGVKERLQWASELLPDTIAKAKAAHRDIRASVDTQIRPGDVLVLPSSPRVAPPLNSPVDKIEVEYREQAMRLLCIAGLNGLPQISLPQAKIDGLPIGLSIAGPRNSDRALLELARRAMG